MKFSDLAARLEIVRSEGASTSSNALTEIQENHLFDISGAEYSCTGGTSGGSGQSPQFNAFCAFDKAF